MKEKNYSLLRKLLWVSVYVLRYIKRKIWNKTDQKKFLLKYKLLKAALNNVKDFGYIAAQEINFHPCCGHLLFNINNNMPKCFLQ